MRHQRGHTNHVEAEEAAREDRARGERSLARASAAQHPRRPPCPHHRRRRRRSNRWRGGRSSSSSLHGPPANLVMGRTNKKKIQLYAIAVRRRKITLRIRFCYCARGDRNRRSGFQNRRRKSQAKQSKTRLRLRFDSSPLRPWRPPRPPPRRRLNSSKPPSPISSCSKISRISRVGALDAAMRRRGVSSSCSSSGSRRCWCCSRSSTPRCSPSVRNREPLWNSWFVCSDDRAADLGFAGFFFFRCEQLGLGCGTTRCGGIASSTASSPARSPTAPTSCKCLLHCAPELLYAAMHRVFACDGSCSCMIRHSCTMPGYCDWYLPGFISCLICTR